LPPKSYVGGSPAEPRKEFINSLMHIKRIKGIGRRLKELEERFAKLRPDA
jgi:UDP-3-O-[3-hydroxymyristoyl] glucosamine N-acyltransferase